MNIKNLIDEYTGVVVALCNSMFDGDITPWECNDSIEIAKKELVKNLLLSAEDLDAPSF